jgi:ribonuclease G
MSNTLILYEKNNAYITAGFVENKLSLFEIEEKDNPYRVGNIYAGRVSKIVMHLKSAYIDIGMPKLCYMELSQKTSFVSDKLHPDGELHVGDIILVQIVRDATATKPVSVSSEISIADKYFVTKLGSEAQITFSSKIKDGIYKKAVRKELEGIMINRLNLLVRTNAKDLDAEELSKEALRSISFFQSILDALATKQKATLIYKKESDYITNLRDNSVLKYDKVVTDSPEIYLNLKEWIKEQESASVPPEISFYSDKILPLENLYDMRKNISELCRSRVWLNSGAHIVIEQTEAMITIDVNSSKSSASSKNFKDGFSKINIEAAKEIVRQLRLRSLSGIIVIDFINMKDVSSKDFLDKLTEICKADPEIKVVDMTGLGLVEITRRRNRQPVYELIKKYKLDE